MIRYRKRKLEKIKIGKYKKSGNTIERRRGMKRSLLQSIFEGFYKSSEEAKLIAKNTEVTYGTTMYMNSGKVQNGVNKKETIYIVSFRTASKKTKTFFVSRSCYEKLEINERGILVYQGKKMISFHGIDASKSVQSKEKGMEFIGMNRKM